MKHLIIIGAGGMGRTMYSKALESVGYGKTFDIKDVADVAASRVKVPSFCSTAIQALQSAPSAFVRPSSVTETVLPVTSSGTMFTPNC